jgi:ankyrin repeat protein
MSKGFDSTIHEPRSGRIGWARTFGWVVSLAVVITLLTKLKTEQEAQSRMSGVPLVKEWMDGTNDRGLQAAIASNDYDSIRSKLKVVSVGAMKPEMVHRFTYDRRLSALRAFLDSGWPVDGERNDGRPIATAVALGQTDAALMLMERGARVNVNDDRGIPVTCLAALRNATRSKILAALLERGADPNRPSTAVLSDFSRLSRSEAIESRHRLWPLEVAVRTDQPDVARLLIRYGADPKALDPQCPSLLAVTASHEDDLQTPGDECHEMLELLLNYGVPVDGVATVVISNPDLTRRPVRGTALFVAILRGDAKAVQMLLEHGADLDTAYRGEIMPTELRRTQMRPIAQ